MISQLSSECGNFRMVPSMRKLKFQTTCHCIPGLTSQRHSALISSDSEYFQVCFSAVHYLKISEQRWFSSEQRWKRKFSELKISTETALFSSETELIQSWTALIFSETALKLEIFRAKKSALISYLSWKFRYYSFMAKIDLILFPQIFSRKPQISSSLEI